MKRKILSILLVLAMTLTLLPTAVLAEETSGGGNVITLENNSTYTLSADTTATIVVPSGVAATLDLNGNELSNANDGKATLSVEGTVKVINGTITGGSSYYNIEVKKGGSLTLENVTATAGNTGSSMIDNWGTLTIESGTYTGGLNVIKNEPDGTLTINSGEFELLTGSAKGYTGVIFNYGTLKIANGTFKQSSTNSKYGYAQVIFTDKDSSANPSTTITGGTFINSHSNSTAWTIRSTNAATPYTKVTAGRFNKSLSTSYLPDGYATTKKDGYYVLETAIMGITLDQTEVRLKVGESITLNAVSTTPEDAAITTWTIRAKSGGSFVTTSTHKVTGKAIGDAVIIATPAGAGSTPAECTVHVYDEVAQIGEVKYPTFEKALENAQPGDTITLLKNVSLKATAAIDKNITLDLGGYTLTGPRTTVKSGGKSWYEYIALKITAGTVDVKNGKISGRVNVYDAANVTLEKDATITNKGYNSSTDGYGIVVWGDGTYGQEGCKTPVLNLYGKVNVTGTKGVAISTNGIDASKPVINIYDGAEITSEKCSGIYLPSGALTVSGGSITGATGIYFKSTDMTVSGGTVSGNGVKADYEFYGNGANTTGDAVVIDNCNYPSGIGKVELTGGNFKSVNADAVGSYAGNGQTTPLTGFITGGTFNTNPSAYVTADRSVVKNGDGTYTVLGEMTKVDAVAATCTETGHKEYWTADDSKYTYSDGVYTQASDADLLLDALGHEFADEYVSDETGHWHKCIRCDATGEKAAHRFDTDDCSEKATCEVCGYEKPTGDHTWNDGVVTTEPTTSAEGVKTYTCTVCGATKTETIDKLPSGNGGSSGGGSSSSGSATKTETTTNPDGSTTKTETKADGTAIETTTTTDGSVGTTTIDKSGTTTEIKVKISDKAIEEAEKKDASVTAPVEVEAGKNSNSAPSIKIELPKNADETKVEIPVSNVTSGTVAVIVNEDGTEEIVKTSVVTENGVALDIKGSATVKIIDNSKEFLDTKDHWSRDEVNFVASRELFNGIGNNLFGVSGNMTRGMVNTVLARLAGEDTNGGVNWYDKGTEWAKKNGVSDGTNPTANVTREQLAAMLYRFAGSPAVSGGLTFADADQVSDYAKDALIWAVQNNILNGIGDNLVAPQNSAERAQVAAMMARYLKNVG